MSRQIYLDYAAATPLDPKVLSAMQPYLTDNFYNPSATYLAAGAVRKDLETARATAARLIGSRPAEIIFTAGATEANNLAIQGIMRQFPDGEVLVSAIEHDSVLEPAGLFNHQEIPVDEKGLIKLNMLSNLITDKTILLSVGMVNNEIGVIQPLREISATLKDIRVKRRTQKNHRPIYLHTDAAQAGNYLDLHVSRLGIDLMSLNGGKVYGPKQSGALYVKAGLKLQPLILGGGQEQGLRSGTENVAGIIGFCVALGITQQDRAAEGKRVSELRGYFEDQVTRGYPSAILNGSLKYRAPHIASITFPGRDNERLMMELDERGIQCASGSACNASSQEPSHVLSAIGLSKQSARSTLRFSFGRQTTKTDLDYAIKQLNLIE